MTTTPALWTRTVGVCLLLAPLLQVAEAGLSPLSGDTGEQLDSIAANETAFVASVLLGLVATVLYVPALVGLAHHVSDRSPRLSLAAALLCVCSMVGFAGVRAVQGVQLGLVRSDIDREAAVALVDSAADNPVLGAFLILFMAGTVVGLSLLVVAVWRSGRFPKVPLVLVLAFVVFDLLGAPLADVVDSRLIPVVAHLVVLTGLGWLGLVVLRQVSPAPRPAEIGQPERVTRR